jgi:hypothetical protein
MEQDLVQELKRLQRRRREADRTIREFVWDATVNHNRLAISDGTMAQAGRIIIECSARIEEIYALIDGKDADKLCDAAKNPAIKPERLDEQER